LAKDKATAGDALATKPDNAVVDPSTMQEFATFAGQGLEKLSRDDLAIPFWTILQSGSPQVKRSDGEFIEGAAEGMLYNTVTKQLVDPLKDKFVIVPAAYERWFIEWKLRENGGGFIRQHTPDPAMMLATTRDEKGRDIMENSNQLNDTRTFYVLVMIGEDPVPQPGFLSLTSTQIRKAKQWLMQMNMLKLQGPNGMYTPPMFATKWSAKTVPESNDKGSWMGWAFEFAGYLKGVADPVFVEAQALHKSVQTGAVKADLSKTATDGSDTPSRQPGEDDDDDVTF
jgi:hypothetical protein